MASLLLVTSFIALSQGIADNMHIESYGTILYQSPNARVLYVDGTKLRSPTGEVAVLQGTQFDYNALALHGDNWFGLDDVQKMKSYGGKVLELHALWFSYMMPQKGVIDENWFSNKLDKWVSWCEQMQMYYIISVAGFDMKPWGDPEMPQWFLEGKYNPPYDKTVYNQASIDFWDIDNPLQDDSRQYFIDTMKFIADRYKNNTYLLFGIVNEPFAGNHLVNRDNAEHLSVTYARFVERIIDAIRSTGAKHLIFVDKPYCWWYTNHFEQVNRDSIVWEDHLYAGLITDIDEWKSILNEYVQRYVYNFKKPFYLGEYGPYPFEEYNNGLSNWRTILAEQVTSLKSVPVCGYSWHEYPYLEGEWYDSVHNYLNAEESEYILRTIYG